MDAVQDAVASSQAVTRADDPAAKRALLRSGLRLFVRDGLRETTIRCVAADAGYSNPAIFKFFRNRDALAQCIFDRCYERLAEKIDAATREPRFESRLRAIVDASVQFMDDDLNAFLFVNEQLRRFWPQAPVGLRDRSILRMIRELLELGRQEGTVSAEHDPALLIAAVIGTLTQFARGIYFEEIEGPGVRRARELERLLLRAVR